MQPLADLMADLEGPRLGGKGNVHGLLEWRLRPASTIRISASRMAPSFIRHSTVSFDLPAMLPAP